MVSFTYFDRYVMPLLVPFLLLLYFNKTQTEKTGRISIVFTAIYLMVLFYFSITGTKTYLEWNKVRWEAAGKLMESGISPANIDGGHEFNGWNGAEIDKYGKWDPDKYEYTIAFSEMVVNDTVFTRHARNYITWSDYPIYILKKTP